MSLVTAGDSEAVLEQRAPVLQAGAAEQETSRRGSRRGRLFLALPQAGQFPAGRRKGAAGRFRTRWLRLLLLSLFLPFDLRRARSPVGSLSWPGRCLITCGEGTGRAEEEPGCCPAREGLDKAGDEPDPLGMKLVARGCRVPAWSWGDPKERWKPGHALAAGGLVEEWESPRIWPVTDGQCLVRAQLTQPLDPTRWQLPHHRGAHPAPGAAATTAASPAPGSGVARAAMGWQPQHGRGGQRARAGAVTSSPSCFV